MKCFLKIAHGAQLRVGAKQRTGLESSDRGSNPIKVGITLKSDPM